MTEKISVEIKIPRLESSLNSYPNKRKRLSNLTSKQNPKKLFAIRKNKPAKIVVYSFLSLFKVSDQAMPNKIIPMINVLDSSKPKEKNSQAPIVTTAINKAITHNIEVAQWDFLLFGCSRLLANFL